MPDPPLYTPNDSTDPDPDPVSTGPAAAPLVMTGGIGTNFADPKDRARYFAAKQRGASEQQALSVGDPGVGAPSLGTVNTAQAYGVAAPEDWLRKTFGDDQSNWRKARAQLNIGDKTITVPIVDIGPGKGARAKGVVTDMTALLQKALGVGDDNPQVQIKFMADAGPDYSGDRAAWNQEQQQIAAALAQPLALSSAAPTPYAQGGIVTKPTIALVGEKGPEAIVPLAGNNGSAFPGIGSMMVSDDSDDRTRAAERLQNAFNPNVQNLSEGEPDANTQRFWYDTLTKFPMEPSMKKAMEENLAIWLKERNPNPSGKVAQPMPEADVPVKAWQMKDFPKPTITLAPGGKQPNVLDKYLSALQEWLKTVPISM